MAPQLLIIFSILGWGVGSLFYKLSSNHLHPLMMSVVITSVYLVLTPLSLLFLNFDKTINIPGVSYAIIGSLCMCVGTLGNFWAMRNGGGAGSVAVLTSLYPALTLILSAFFLKETFTLKQGIGIVLALVAFILMGTK